MDVSVRTPSLKPGVSIRNTRREVPWMVAGWKEMDEVQDMSPWPTMAVVGEKDEMKVDLPTPVRPTTATRPEAGYIILMGMTGSGKTIFISRLTGPHTEIGVGHTLSSSQPSTQHPTPQN